MRTLKNGAWGPGPLDNDAGADWLGNALSGIPQRVESGLRSENPDDVRAAAWLLGQVGYLYAYSPYYLAEHLDLAIERLKALAEDEEYLSLFSVGGRDVRKKVCRSIREQLDQLIKLRKRVQSDAELAEGRPATPPSTRGFMRECVVPDAPATASNPLKKRLMR